MSEDEKTFEYQQRAFEGAARYLQEYRIGLIPSYVSRMGGMDYNSNLHRHGIPKITETDRRKSVFVNDKLHSDVWNILKTYGENGALPKGWKMHREDVYITPTRVSMEDAVFTNEQALEVEMPLFDAEIIVRNPQGIKYRAIIQMDEIMDETFSCL
jgi:hypothetical protein